MKFNIPCKSNPMPYYVGQIDYSTLPLTFKSYGTTSIYLGKNGTPNSNHFYYNKNDSGWTDYTNNATGSSISLEDGDIIAFSGTTSGLSLTTDSQTWRFQSSGDGWLEVYGNIQSMNNYQPLYAGIYRALFWGCERLSSAWNLYLPSANIPIGCYASLFRQTNVYIAPKMMIVDNSDGLPSNCFDATFYTNSRMKYIGADFKWGTDRYGTANNWCNGVSSNGVFVRTSRVTYARGAGQIPTNWTVVDYNFNGDGKYYLDNNGTPTNTEVIVNPDGSITYV